MTTTWTTETITEAQVRELPLGSIVSFPGSKHPGAATFIARIDAHTTDSFVGPHTSVDASEGDLIAPPDAWDEPFGSFMYHTRPNAPYVLWRRTPTSSVEDLEHDIATIWRELLAEANRREWCGEFDEFVERLRGQMKTANLPARNQTFTVGFTVTLPAGDIQPCIEDHVRRALLRSLRSEVPEALRNNITIDDYLCELKEEAS